LNNVFIPQHLFQPLFMRMKHLKERFFLLFSSGSTKYDLVLQHESSLAFLFNSNYPDKRNRKNLRWIKNILYFNTELITKSRTQWYILLYSIIIFLTFVFYFDFIFIKIQVLGCFLFLYKQVLPEASSNGLIFAEM
jgi:hypothetical protein